MTKDRVFSGPNTGKYGAEKLRIWTLFDPEIKLEFYIMLDVFNIVQTHISLNNNIYMNKLRLVVYKKFVHIKKHVYLRMEYYGE